MDKLKEWMDKIDEAKGREARERKQKMDKLKELMDKIDEAKGREAFGDLSNIAYQLVVELARRDEIPAADVLLKFKTFIKENYKSEEQGICHTIDNYILTHILGLKITPKKKR